METINFKCTNCIHNGECKINPDYCAGYFGDNNVLYGTIAPEEFHKDYTLQIGYGAPKIKSHLKIGNLIIHNTHHFNWLERKMWKLLLGFDIENVKEE